MLVKTCLNCGYKNDDNCLYSGYTCKIERQSPTKCGQNFEAWKPADGVTVPAKIPWYKRIFSHNVSDNYWTEKDVKEFVNYYIDFHGLEPRYRLPKENRVMIKRFLKTK